MSPRRRESYERALHALSLMRRSELPITSAADEAGTTSETVVRYVRPALRRVGGRWVAKPSDRLERSMRLYDPEGSLRVTVGSSTSASRIGQYNNAVRWFLETGDDSRLRPFAGKYVLDVEGERQYFLTDPAAVRRLARAGEFRFESIY